MHGVTRGLSARYAGACMLAVVTVNCSSSPPTPALSQNDQDQIVAGQLGSTVFGSDKSRSGQCTQSGSWSDNDTILMADPSGQGGTEAFDFTDCNYGNGYNSITGSSVVNLTYTGQVQVQYQPANMVGTTIILSSNGLTVSGTIGGAPITGYSSSCSLNVTLPGGAAASADDDSGTICGRSFGPASTGTGGSASSGSGGSCSGSACGQCGTWMSMCTSGTLQAACDCLAACDCACACEASCAAMNSASALSLGTTCNFSAQ